MNGRTPFNVGRSPSPDGSKIVFTNERAGHRQLMRRSGRLLRSPV
jgi:Tol biopolymer transport system component